MDLTKERIVITDGRDSWEITRRHGRQVRGIVKTFFRMCWPQDREWSADIELSLILVGNQNTGIARYFSSSMRFSWSHRTLGNAGPGGPSNGPPVFLRLSAWFNYPAGPHPSVLLTWKAELRLWIDRALSQLLHRAYAVTEVDSLASIAVPCVLGGRLLSYYSNRAPAEFTSTPVEQGLLFPKNM